MTGAGLVQQSEHGDPRLVSMRTSDTDYREAGTSPFVVPRNSIAVDVRGYWKIDGGPAAEVKFDDVKLCADPLVGPKGDGFAMLEHATGLGLVALAAEGPGAMDVARDLPVDYVRTRKQFCVPIGSCHLLQRRTVRPATRIKWARWAVISAAAALASPRSKRERGVSAANYTVGCVGARVAEESVQLHGAIGTIWELRLVHYAKRLVMIDHQFGDENHRIDHYIRPRSMNERPWRPC